MSGDISLVPAPASVTRNAFEDTASARVFLERPVPYILPGDITVDITAPGLYDQRRDLPTPRPVLTPSDKLFSSYLLHADHAGNAQVVYEGSITFDVDSPIFGVMLRRSTLDLLEDGTDAPLGADATLYPTYQARGLELRKNKEWVELSNPDANGYAHTLSFRFETKGGIDQIRILIDPPFTPEIFDIPSTPLSIPEPASMVLLASGLAVLGLRTWSRRPGR